LDAFVTKKKLFAKIKHLFEQAKALFNRVPIRNRVFLIGDLFLIVTSVLVSFALRFELGNLFVYYLPQAIRMAILALVIKPLIYYSFGLYRRLWAYASTHELRLILSAVTSASVVLSVAVILMTYIQAQLPGYIGFPRATLVIDWLLSILLTGGLRFSSRLIAESRSTAANGSERKWIDRRALIIGAGDAGALVVREIQKNPQLNLNPICFLDDDEAKQKSQIHGVPVVGTLDNLRATIKNKRIQEVIIAIPTAPGKLIRRLADICRQEGVGFRTMPGIYELIGGKVSVSRLRKVNINDLLRRASAINDDRRVGSVIAGRRVLVTGGGGSIGTELCRQIARWGPSTLVIVGHGENSVYETYLDHRRHPRPRSVGQRLRRRPPPGGLPRRGAQTRSDDGDQHRGGGDQQHPRYPQRGRIGDELRRRAAGDGLDRQSDPPDQRDGRDQTNGRTARPGRGPEYRPSLLGGSLWQRAGQPRLGGAPLSETDRQRRSGDGHPPGHGTLLHDDP
jgi:hypothetical protein